MRPLPPIDDLELVEAHPGIMLAVLRDGLVLVEFRLPCGRIERRHHAGPGFAYDDRRARLGWPGCSAHDEGREHQGRNRQQPQPDGAAPSVGGRSEAGHGIIRLPSAWM